MHQFSGKQQHLRLGAEGVEEFARAGKGVDRGDDLLDLAQAEAVLLQDAEAPAHELVVVGLVARRAAELGNAARLRERDPDFGHEDALDIQADNVHFFFFPLFAQAGIV